MTQPRVAIIIGAGPAGLTAAYELLKRSDIRPVVLEADQYLGGLARTVNYHGNRIDIGGHRFFSKSSRVMQWWLQILPLEKLDAATPITYQGRQDNLAPAPGGPDPATTDRVMLVRARKSRIYFLRRFFDYPITLSAGTLCKLGPIRVVKIIASYLHSAIHPIRPETNLEQFFINRFGRQLYLTFFKSYTEKVWGVPCNQISADWGRQRIKGLSVAKAISHFLGRTFRRRSTGDLAQKQVETSLIERFLYPKLGPGQMWEEVAHQVVQMGGQVIPGARVEQIEWEQGAIKAVTTVDSAGQRRRFTGDYFFSSMPIKDLIAALQPAAPAPVKQVSDHLIYRDFITVGLLLPRLKVGNDRDPAALLPHDNWVYIQEPDVLVGRLQLFNNWSPYMVRDPKKAWIGLEYFCQEGDALWRRSDADMIALASEELDRIGIIDRSLVEDATVLRMPKAYPAYFGAYEHFDVIRAFLDSLGNLFPIGRNGMHKYNNQDHSMLTAMTGVDLILAGRTDKTELWSVNTQQEYHEESGAAGGSGGGGGTSGAFGGSGGGGGGGGLG